MSEHEWFPMEPPRRFGHLKRPKLIGDKVADPGLRVVLNRYPFSIIGFGVVVGRWCASLTWGRPIRYGELGKDDPLTRWANGRAQA